MTDKSSGLIISGQPLIFTKELAIKVGVSMAILVQQVHFMISRYGKEDSNGEKWLRWAHEKWQRKVFPFWSDSTIRRMMYEAQAKGWLLITAEAGTTPSYSFDYDKFYGDNGQGRAGVGKTTTPSLVKMNTPQGGQTEHPQDGQSDHPVPHIERLTEKREVKEEQNRPPLRSGRVSSSQSSVKDLQKEIRQKSLREFRAKFEKSATAHSAISFWKTISAEHFGRVRVPLTEKDTRNMKLLIKFCNEAGVNTLSFLEYCIVNWGKIGRKLAWAKVSDTPIFGTAFALKSQIMEIYQKNGGSESHVESTVITDISQVPKEHPQYMQIAKALKHAGTVTLHS